MITRLDRRERKAALMPTEHRNHSVGRVLLLFTRPAMLAKRNTIKEKKSAYGHMDGNADARVRHIVGALKDPRRELPCRPHLPLRNGTRKRKGAARWRTDNNSVRRKILDNAAGRVLFKVDMHAVAVRHKGGEHQQDSRSPQHLDGEI